MYFDRYRLLWEGEHGTVGSDTALQAGRSEVRFLVVSLGSYIDLILPTAPWPWGRLSL